MQELGLYPDMTTTDPQDGPEIDSRTEPVPGPCWPGATCGHGLLLV